MVTQNPVAAVTRYSELTGESLMDCLGQKRKREWLPWNSKCQCLLISWISVSIRKEILKYSFENNKDGN